MSFALNFFTAIAVVAGAFFFLAGTVGLLRFPDTLTRLHALTKAERQRRIRSGDAYPLRQLILADCPNLHIHVPLLDRAYQIASAARIGIYDCIYVALAERENCALVTADERIIKSLQAT